MPTGPQIKAARMLAKWEQTNLAEAASLTTMTIQNAENEYKHTKKETMASIVGAFARIGIEFTENEGVRRRPASVKTFEGKEGFTAFYDFVYEHLSIKGGAVCICGSSGRVFGQYRNNPELHRKRMAELVRQREDVTVRILAADGDVYMPNSAYAEYRWQPKEFFPPTTFYAFGEYLGIISFDYDPAPLVVLIHSKSIADSYRQSFDFTWKNAKVPPHED